MQIQRQKTHKLFYNKYPYKVSCFVKQAHLISRYKDLAGLSNLFDIEKIGKYEYDNIMEFAAAYRSLDFSNTEIKIRAEGFHFNLFIKDTTTVDIIISKLRNWVTCITEPENDTELKFLISESKKVLCDNIPLGQYRFKVYLKTNIPINLKESFLNWARRYEDKFDIAYTTKDWLANRRQYIQTPFFYVEDDATATMTRLFLSNHIRRIEEFIPRNSINTPCLI
jgi:hypothetical protein